MKSLQELLPQVQAITSLQKYSQNTSEISVYRDTLTNEGMITQISKMRKVFTQAAPGFYDVLLERIKENNFTDERLKDAVNYLIDNFKYPVPSIADIISFDKKVKLHTYQQVCDKVTAGDKFENYERMANGFYISKAEKIQYNLK